MLFYFWLALASAVISVILVKLFSQYARKHRVFMPDVRTRDVHDQPVPRVGGLAIIGSFLVIVLGLLLVGSRSLHFTNHQVLGIDKNLLGVLLAVVLLTVVNVMDDFKNLSWPIKLAAQVVAAAIVAYFGIRIGWLSSPLGGHVILGTFDFLIVVFWLVGLTNVVNWVDGLDGLAGGVSLITLLVLFFLSLSVTVNQPSNATLAAVISGAVIGFLPFNFGSRSKVFLGDAGAMFLGFMIGVISIISGGKVATVFLALAIPFLDAVFVLFTRLLRGQSPFLADQNHLHHRLLARSWRPWQITALFCLISLIFGLIALNTQTVGKFWAILAALAIMIILVLLYSKKDTNKGND